jgi:hypothetical protein
MVYCPIRGAFLYTRELKSAPERPVVNGKPVFGSFSGIFKEFDIQGLKRPFGNLPIPTFITDARVMETLRFAYCDENDIGEIEIFNARYFSFMETTLWNRKTGHRLAYRRIIPGGIIHIPRNFDNSVTACRTRSRYVRIFTKLQMGFVHADFDFIGSNSRPPCEGRLELNVLAHGSAQASFLVPYGVKRRCLGSCQITAPLHGWISTRYDDHQIREDSGVGYFDVRKAYFSLRTKINQMLGLGRISGKVVSFNLGSSVSHDDSRYNDNVLFTDGTTTPLPPVKITFRDLG